MAYFTNWPIFLLLMSPVGDGTCFVIQQDLDYVLDLTEADCDPVYKVRNMIYQPK